MNISIPFEIECEVISGHIYEKKEGIPYSIPCRIIGVSTYLDQPITFHALIDGMYLYSNLPISAFINGKKFTENTSSKRYNLKELSHIMCCPAYEIDPFTLPRLSKVAVYFKESKTWEFGNYLMSFDFYTSNELLHLIEMDNGQYSLSPNHKCNWSCKKELSNYKKQRSLDASNITEL